MYLFSTSVMEGRGDSSLYLHNWLKAVYSKNQVIVKGIIMNTQ